MSVPGTGKRKGPGALRSFCEWSGKSPRVPYCSSDMISQNIKLRLFWSFVIFLPVCRISSSPCAGSDGRRGPEAWRGMTSSPGAGRPGIIGNQQQYGLCISLPVLQKRSLSVYVFCSPHLAQMAGDQVRIVCFLLRKAAVFIVYFYIIRFSILFNYLKF